MSPERMTVEINPEEAEILIAVLTFAEGCALKQNPAITEALQALRPWRSTLLATWLRSRFQKAEARP